MGAFNFKTGVPATDIVISNDGGGTVQGIDVIFDSFQDESLAANTDRFTRAFLTPLGLSASTIGVTFALDAGLDTFTMQIRKTNGLWDMQKMTDIGRVIKYAFDQTKDAVVTSSSAIVDAFDDYASDRLTSNAAYITLDGLTGNPILHYAPLAVDVVGTNALVHTRELWEGYLREILGLNLSYVGYQYALGADFTVNVPVGTSTQTNATFTRFAAATAQGSIVSFYHAAVIGLRTLAV